ncbi:MAG: tetratricopeptide repeat protein [Bryobacteraceae bacterium]
MKPLISLVGLISFLSVAAVAQRDDRRVPGAEDPLLEELVEQSQTYGQPFHHHHNGWCSYKRPEQWNDNGTATTVSRKQLAHKIPGSAVKEQRKGRTALEKGDYQVAKKHLENALAIDSQFADAHNDLGVVIGKSGQTDRAIPEFQKAIELTPEHKQAVANLCVALYTQGRYHDVCPAARRALKIDPSLVHIRFLLALSLITDGGDEAEALTNLERAAPQVPEAHVALSNLLVKIGRREDAARELEMYLRSAQKQAATKQEVEARIASLRR